MSRRTGLLCAGPSPGQHLRRHDPEREPGIDQLVAQAHSRQLTALDDGLESGLPGITDLVEVVECGATVEIGHGDLMTRGPQLVGELADTLGQVLRMMEQDHIGHRHAPRCAVSVGRVRSDSQVIAWVFAHHTAGPAGNAGVSVRGRVNCAVARGRR